MKNCDRKPEHIFLHIIQMNLNTLRNLTKFSIAKSTVGSSYKESKFKPCLTKQLLNMFNPEWGFSLMESEDFRCMTVYMLNWVSKDVKILR